MCHSRTPSVIPVKTGIQSAISRSPIRSVWLSVEDDKGWVIPVKTGIQSEWIPSQAGDDKECVIPVKTGIQSAISGSPIRSAWLSVEDDPV